MSSRVDQVALFGNVGSRSSDEWYTPRWLFDAAGLTFDLDVCAPMDMYSRTCPARQFLTIENDGLSAQWHGLIWCNPPYSNIAPWVERWAAHPSGLILIPALPEVYWHSRINADAIALINIRFHRPTHDGTSRNRWVHILGARGKDAVAALSQVASADKYAGGTYYIRPDREQGE